MTAAELVDRFTAAIAPRFTLRRQRARLASEMLARSYDAAAAGRRTSGWRRTSADANAVIGQGLERTRDVARDLVRNNAFAASAINTIVDHVVGWGIVTNLPKGSWWDRWANSTACDADGRLDLAGLQKLVMRSVAESGEVLIRRRLRRATDNLPLPLQLQVLEGDYLDTMKEGRTESGGQIIQGIEFSPIGQVVGYWLFREHPGAQGTFASGVSFGASVRIPASEILHVFKPERPGQVRGISWLAPIILRLKDFADYEDAALMKQKVAACLALVMTDPDGTLPSIGTTTTDQPMIDTIGPGAILNATPGRTVTVVQPPSVSEHDPYTKTVLRAIATGLGITYEDLVGSYEGLPYSAARMSRLRAWARVEDWRWRILVPQFCAPVWSWASEAAAVMNLPVPAQAPEWTAPAMPSVDPETESNAYKRLVRIGGISWPEMIRERGYDPEAVLREIEDWNARLDAAGVILDSDPRKTTEGGNPRDPKPAATSPSPTPAPASTNGTSNGRHLHLEDQPVSAARVRMLERELEDMRTQVSALAARQPETHVHVATPAAPNVDARTELRVEAGAVQVAAAPPPDVRVEAPVTIAEGAVRVETPVTIQPSPPAEVTVDARTTIAEGAVRLDAPTTITPAAPPPAVTVVRPPETSRTTRRRRERPDDGE